MPSSKLTKYCRIFQWIEKNDPDLAECIKDLCLEGALTPYRGINGITFLMPGKSSNLRSKILKYTYSSKPNEDADTAVKLIESLIITDNLPDIEKFEFYSKHSTPMGNKLRIRQTIDKVTKNSTGGIVSLNKGTCTIKPVTDFNILSKRNPDQETNRYNISIWNIIEGEPATEGEKFNIQRPVSSSSSGKGKGKGKGKRSSSNDPCVTGGGQLTRKTLNISLIKDFMVNIHNKNISSNNVYLKYTYYLLNMIKKSNIDVFKKIQNYIDYDPIITFYILFLPYREKSIFISDEILDPYMTDEVLTNILLDKSNAVTINAYHSNFIPMFDRDRGIDSKSYHYSNVKNSGNILDELIEEYSTIYKEDTSKTLWCDQFRFLARGYLDSMLCSMNKSEKENEFDRFIYFIEHIMPGKNFEAELIRNNVELICGPLDIRKEKIRITKKFLKSNDFLYSFTPLPELDVHGGDEETDDISQVLSDIEGGNIDSDHISNFMGSGKNRLRGKLQGSSSKPCYRNNEYHSHGRGEDDESIYNDYDD